MTWEPELDELAGTADAADKMARVVDTCDQFHLPVVNFVDMRGARP
jgi:acetyl-CoA carboxylase carboxyltransferase component